MVGDGDRGKDGWGLPGIDAEGRVGFTGLLLGGGVGRSLLLGGILVQPLGEFLKGFASTVAFVAQQLEHVGGARLGP